MSKEPAVCDNCGEYEDQCNCTAKPTLSPVSGSMWQPIETAPMDGTYIDIHAGERFTMCKWHRGEWVFWGVDGFQSPGWERVPWNATHWMPIPAPPNTKGQT